MEPLKYRGLSEAEVQESRRKNGENVLAPPVRLPWYRQYLKKFDDPVIRILMLAAILSCLIGDWIEGGGILAAVFLATFLAFLNEFRAEKEFDLLNSNSDELPCKTIRSGAFVMVPRRELVVGDVVFVEQGEEIPADARVLEAVNLQLDQSSLTGETDPVPKFPAGDPAIAHLGECIYPPDQLLRGTPVVEGYGYCEITAVGEHTEIGRTAQAASIENDDPTPLQRQLENLSRIIGLIGFSVAAAVFIILIVKEVLEGKISQTFTEWLTLAVIFVAATIALLRVWLPLIGDGVEVICPRFRLRLPSLRGSLILGIAIGVIGVIAIAATTHPEPLFSVDALRGILTIFMIAVTLIVVAVPEGLAMSVTLSLAYSVRRMTATNNLVRKMHACETIGAATVICTDKTGTLTMNRMRVAEMHFAAFPEGRGARLEECIAVNTTGNLSFGASGSAETVGNPTEGALLLYLHSLGCDFARERFRFQLKSQLTFSTERKFMATAGVSPLDNAGVLYVKGAPEIVLARCRFRLNADGTQEALNETIRHELDSELRSCQARGMRTLALAMKSVELPENADLVEAAQDLTYLGFAAINDPVRPEVPDAVASCRRAGIQVKVVTGDSPETAREIGRQIGLTGDAGDFAEGEIITGRDYAALDDDEAVAVGRKLRIMARARPEDKLKLVRALKRDGAVVAVTGDGTNDAPALNNADVGIAMGKTGTAIAKEAAAIILLDDSFASVVNAVLWGRSLYANIQRFIIFQLTINVTALTVAVAGPFFGVELPLTVIQMLWINLIMDTFAALALATEPPDPAVMNRPPRPNGAFIVTPVMARWIFGTALVLVIFFMAFLSYLNASDDVLTRGELTVFFTTFVLLQFWNLFNVRAFGSSASALHHIGQNRIFLWIAGAILVGQILIVTFGGQPFRVEPLSVKCWIALFAATSLIFWVGEIVRLIFRLREKFRNKSA